MGELGAYGFGWCIDRFNGHRILYHEGASGTAIFRLPDNGITVIVLTNREMLDGGLALPIAQQVASVYVPGLWWTELKPSGDSDINLTSRFAEQQSNFASSNPDLSFYAPDWRMS